jgi:hypothetical protein
MCAPRARRCHYALAARMTRQRAAAELHVMRHRTVVASIAGAALILAGGVAVFLLLDMRAVQHAAAECQPLIDALARVRGETGRYPNASELDSAQAELGNRCHYQTNGASYTLALAGADLNLQTYEFDSGAGQWRWD